jgi:peptidoglycan hydrolase CwlO-like protein
MESFLMLFVTAVFGGVSSLVYAFLERGGRRIPPQENAEQRVERLTKSLREAASFVDEIETEIAASQAKARKLQADVERYEQLSRIHREDLEAIATVLRIELRDESRRTFWQNFAMNFGFFLLGAAASFLLTLLF